MADQLQGAEAGWAPPPRRFPLIGTVSGVSALSLLGLLLSLAVQLLISAHFGTSAPLDAYLFAYSIAMLTTFFVGPLRDAAGPRVFASLSEHPNEAARQLAPILGWLTLGLLLSVAAALVGAWAIEHRWIELSPAIQEQVGGILLWFAPAVLLLGWSEMLNGLFACYHRPVLQQGVRLIAPAAMIAALLVLVDRWGVRALAAGVLLGNAAMVLVQWRLLVRLGLRVRIGWPRTLDRGLLILSGALLFNYALAQVYAVIEKTAFTATETGLMSAFNYGVAITNVLVTLLAIAIARTIYPRLLTAAQKRDRGATATMIGAAIQWLAFLAAGASAAIWVAADDVVQVLFARGHFDAASVALTGAALRAAVFTCVPIGIYTLAGHALLAWQSQKALAVAGVSLALVGMGFIAMAVLFGSRNLLMLHWLVANTIGAILAVHFLRRHLQESRAELDRAAWQTIRALACAILICLGASYLPITFSAGSPLFMGVIQGSGTLAAYLILCWLVRAVPRLSLARWKP